MISLCTCGKLFVSGNLSGISIRVVFMTTVRVIMIVIMIIGKGFVGVHVIHGDVSTTFFYFCFYVFMDRSDTK